jgi:hypothetical protein
MQLPSTSRTRRLSPAQVRQLLAFLAGEPIDNLRLELRREPCAGASLRSLLTSSCSCDRQRNSD